MKYWNELFSRLHFHFHYLYGDVSVGHCSVQQFLFVGPQRGELRLIPWQLFLISETQGRLRLGVWFWVESTYVTIQRLRATLRSVPERSCLPGHGTYIKSSNKGLEDVIARSQNGGLLVQFPSPEFLIYAIALRRGGWLRGFSVLGVSEIGFSGRCFLLRACQLRDNQTVLSLVWGSYLCQMSMWWYFDYVSWGL